MTDELKRLSEAIKKAFAPGGSLAAIADHTEREKLLDMLPPDEKALAEGLSRYADLCRFFSEQQMNVPPHIVRAVGQLHKLPIADRISQIGDINEALLEYLQNVSEDIGLRM
jgi:hypothetical protein